MPTLSVKQFGNTFRILLLLISFIAVGCAIVYQWYPSLLHRLDRILINAYLTPYEDRLTQARQALNTGDSQAIAILEGLLTDLKKVRHMDRLKRIKRQAFVWVVDALMAADHPDRALYWAQQWAAYDEKDLEGQVALARIWYLNDATHQQGLQRILALYRMAPEADKIAEAYVEAMSDQGHGLSALQAILKHSEGYRAAPFLGWEVFFTSGKRFSRRNMHALVPVIGEDHSMKLTFEVPPGTRMIRLDPPLGLELMVVNPQVRYTACKQTRRQYLVDSALKYHQMTLVHDALITTGTDDPFFYWPLASGFRAHRVVVEMSAQVYRPCPSWLGIKGSRSAGTLTRTSASDADALQALAMFSDLESDLARCSEMTRQLTIDHRANQTKILAAVAGGRIKIYWKSGTLGFAEARTCNAPLNARLAGNHIVFDMVLPVGAVLDQIRIDFPEINGAVFRIEEAQIIGPDGNSAIKFNRQSIGHAHSLEILEETFRVTGKDPYVALSLAQGKVQVNSLHLRGMVR